MLLSKGPTISLPNNFNHQIYPSDLLVRKIQSYVIKSAPWTILWFRILGIFSVEYIKRLCVFMFKTCSNSQLLRRVLWISAEQPIGASLKHKNTQPLYIFSRVRVLHLNRLKERTWLHSFGYSRWAAQYRLNGRLSSFFSFFSFWLIKTWCTSNWISNHTACIDELI